MCTSHVGDRRAPGVLRVPAVGPVLRAIGEVGNSAVGRAARRALLGDTRERARRIARALIGAERRLIGAETRFEEHAIRGRLRPGQLTDTRMCVEILTELRRRRRAQATESEWANPVAAVGLRPASILAGVERRAVAGVLLVPVHVDLVLRGRLERQPQRVQPPALGTAYFLRPIGRIEPFGRAGIEVGEDVGNPAMLSLITGRDAVPEAILQDRAPHAEREVPLLDQRAWSRQPRGLQLRTVVAAHHPAARSGRVDVAGERVAAALRDDAERRTADFRFTKSARCRRHHFLRVGNVRDVGRDAAAAETGAGVQSVHLHAAFVIASAGAAKHGHLRCDLHVRGAAANRHDAGNEQRRCCPRARRRNRGEDITADRRLSSDAGDVNDR